MHAIVSHTILDFDGLASMIAAQKLYPEGRLYFSGAPSENVQSFMALYCDIFEIKMFTEAPLEKINMLTVVDTRSQAKIGVFAQLLKKSFLEVRVIDHHSKEENDIGGKCWTKPVGANTTILAEKIKEKDLGLTEWEATVMLLGIYEDTGCLLYKGTTPEDVEMAAYLLRQGAILEVVADFLDRPLNQEQRLVLKQLLENSRVFSLGGLSCLIAFYKTDKYLSGLDVVTHKLRDLMAQDLTFLVVDFGKYFYIIGRSSTSLVSAYEVLKKFAGSGHEGAAVAKVFDSKGWQVVRGILGGIKKSLAFQRIAANIMSKPVKTVFAEESMAEVKKLMLRYGHSGFPVIDKKGKMVGVISRRDVEKAANHDLLHAPVKGFMSRNPVTADMQSSWSELQALLMENKIGRLPIVADGHIQGIVSRSDLLQDFYKQSLQVFEANFAEPRLQSQVWLLPKLENRPNPHVWDKLSALSQHAAVKKTLIYLVGGIVRDIILEKPNLDIDISVQGNAIEFARSFCQGKDIKLTVHEKFMTATMFYADGLKIDVATLRQEFYEFPAALPAVEQGSLYQDLYRRDFTINAMAISLNEGDMGQLIDYFSGYEDLRQKKLRVLHNFSFIEDPTRIFRALRFEQRYGFMLEDKTEEYIPQVAQLDIWQKVADYRIREEFLLILREPDYWQIICRLQELNLWQVVLPEIRLTDHLQFLFIAWEKEKSFLNGIWPTVKETVMQLVLLFSQSTRTKIEAIQKRFEWPQEYYELFLFLADRHRHYEKIWQQETAREPGNLHALLRDVPQEIQAYFYLITEGSVREALKKYLQMQQVLQVELSGDDLKQLQLKPGPKYKNIKVALEISALQSGKTYLSKKESLKQVKDLLEMRGT